MRLLYVTDEDPGYRRARRGRGWSYRDDVSGERVTDPDELDRLARLAIPPAWDDVWICREPRGHLQATGRDARGRKQYRYHNRWRVHREQVKFDDLVPFGQALGDLRRHIDEDLEQRADPVRRTIALVAALLDRTLVRVGNECYAQENGTFGLTTLRRRHVLVDGPQITLRFRGKGGRAHEVACEDRRLARMIRRLQDLPGQVLFRYPNGDGELRGVRSEEVNDYLREQTGLEDATAKTFRTWGATVVAARRLAGEDPPPSPRRAQITINTAIDDVAELLGNTRAVCKRSYVHPAVLEAFERGDLPARWAAGPARAANNLTADERRLLAVLRRRGDR